MKAGHLATQQASGSRFLYTCRSKEFDNAAGLRQQILTNWTTQQASGGKTSLDPNFASFFYNKHFKPTTRALGSKGEGEGVVRT